MACKDQLGVVGVGVRILKQLDELLGQQGVQAGVEFVDDEDSAVGEGFYNGSGQGDGLGRAGGLVGSEVEGDSLADRHEPLKVFVHSYPAIPWPESLLD